MVINRSTFVLQYMYLESCQATPTNPWSQTRGSRNSSEDLNRQVDPLQRITESENPSNNYCILAKFYHKTLKT